VNASAPADRVRRAVVIAALALLGACNMVMTKEPLFTAADAAGAPAMKAGLWRQGGDSSCRFDEAQPLASWPACANGFLLKDNGEVGAYQTQAGKKTWNVTPFILASGNPRVFQTRLDASLGGAMLTLPPMYMYAAIEPTKLDAGGRITAVTTWFVLCGPPPPAGAKAPDGTSTRNGTLQPLPGLTMDASANDCVTTSPDAVRHAAAASRQWMPPDTFTSDHWVREGDR
jgi:hypothetical protein